MEEQKNHEKNLWKQYFKIGTHAHKTMTGGFEAYQLVRLGDGVPVAQGMQSFDQAVQVGNHLAKKMENRIEKILLIGD